MYKYVMIQYCICQLILTNQEAPMSFIANLSLKNKVNILLLMPIGAAFLILAIILIYIESYNNWKTLKDSIQNQANIVAVKITPEIISPNNPTTATAILETLKLNPVILSASIATADNPSYAIYQRHLISPIETWSFTPKFIPKTYLLKKPISNNSRIVIKISLHTLYKQIYTNIGLILFSMLCCFILIIILSHWIIKLISTEIFSISKTIENSSKNNNYHIKFNNLNHDAIGKLNTVLNTIFSEINSNTAYLLKINTQNQQELEHLKKTTKESNNSKQEFLAKIDHEIRIPIHAITNLHTLLTKTNLSQQQQNYLTKTDIEINILLDIINNLLYFSKIETKQLELNNTPWNIDNLLDNIANTIAVKAHKKGLELFLHRNRQIPKILIGDDNRLKQAINNIISNLVSLTNSGQICLNIELRKQSKSAVTLLFSIQNSNIQEIHDLAFINPELPVNYTHNNGELLGVKISQNIINSMGGNLEIQNSDKPNSKFFFTLKFPIDTQQNIPQINLNPLKTLVIVESNKIPIYIQKLLSDLHFPSQYISHTEACKANLQTQNYALIIIDCNVETINPDLKIWNSFSNLNILWLVTSINYEQTQQLYNIPKNNILTKPFSLPKLITSIQNITDHQNLPIVKSNLNQIINDSHVLLVEDNYINQQVVCDILKNYVQYVSVVENGKQAVELIKTQNFDLILMDIEIPIMDGIQTSMLIREKNPAKELPIIAMTVHTMKKDREKRFAAGINDYIIKPVNPHHLMQILDKYLPKNKAQIKVEPNSNPIAEVDINFFNGMHHLSNNKTLYLKLLNMFVNKHSKSVTIIESYLTNSDLENAISETHILKGVAANLGANSLSKTASKLELDLKGTGNESEIQANVNQLDYELKQFLVAIENYLLVN